MTATLLRTRAGARGGIAREHHAHIRASVGKEEAIGPVLLNHVARPGCQITTVAQVHPPPLQWVQGRAVLHVRLLWGDGRHVFPVNKVGGGPYVPVHHLKRGRFR
eukprot:scaffold39753_cov65-Phaeocystis_antarctica.AAC.13